MKKLLSIIICGILLLTITGCGNDKTTTDNKEDSNNKIEENIEDEDNTEEKNDNESDEDDSNLKEEDEVSTNAKVVSKFVNSDDYSTYFILMDDNTFVGKRNICEGYVAISGTYEITYKNTLVGVEPETLILTYDGIDPVTNEKAKDVFIVIRNASQTMTNLMVDTNLSSMYICACTGYDFYTVDE